MRTSLSSPQHTALTLLLSLGLVFTFGLVPSWADESPQLIDSAPEAESPLPLWDNYSGKNGINNSAQQCATAFDEVDAGEPISQLPLFAQGTSSVVNGIVNIDISGSPFPQETRRAVQLWNDIQDSVTLKITEGATDPSTVQVLPLEINYTQTLGIYFPATGHCTQKGECAANQIRLNTPMLSELAPVDRTGIIAHELGHALGLKHSCAEGSIMNALFDATDPNQVSEPTHFDGAVVTQNLLLAP